MITLTSWLNIAKKNSKKQLTVNYELVNQELSQKKKNSTDKPKISTELPSLNLMAVENQLSFDRIDNRINILSFNKKSQQDIKCFAFSEETFDTFCQLITNYNDKMCDFLKELLQTNQFYIGGSFGTMFSHFIFGENINLNKYKDADIDIYCISTMKENELESLLKSIAKKFILNEKCLIYKTGILMNIIFKNEETRKIQIIFQVKKTIDEHLAFIDLPITEFTIGFQNNNFIMFYTQLSLFALYKKINFVFEPKSEITNNRILKYVCRGFISVLIQNGEISKICDTDIKELCWIKLKSNIMLNTLNCLITEYINIKNKNIKIEIINDESYSYNSYTNFCWFLIEKKIADFDMSEIKISQRYQHYSNYDSGLSMYYSTKTVIKKIISLKRIFEKKYKYRFDESAQNFKNFNLHPELFKEKILSPSEFINNEEKLFFACVVENFIKKQGVFIFNGKFCTQKECEKYINDELQGIHEEENSYWLNDYRDYKKENTKRNSKSRYKKKRIIL